MEWVPRSWMNVCPTRYMVSPNDVEETRAETDYNKIINKQTLIQKVLGTWNTNNVLMRGIFSSRKGNISLMMSWLMIFVYLLHKCNWCHVIDTVLQLYIIVSLGIKPKSMSVRSWRWTNIASFAAILVLQQGCSWKGQIWALFLCILWVMTHVYGSVRFSAIFSANVLLTVVHSDGIPPLVKTRGLNE